MTLPPWARGPFELLVHAELHFRAGNDFDRRIALIGFDNAVEVAVTCYLSLHPFQRHGREYPRESVELALKNFHTKVEFLETECGRRSIAVRVERSHFIYYHNVRNEQYHEGRASVPDWQDLTAIRDAALWSFAMLFEVDDIGTELDTAVRAIAPEIQRPERDDLSNRLIDNEFGLIDVAGSLYYASEILHAVDADLYQAAALELRSPSADASVGD